MAEAVEVETGSPLVAKDTADRTDRSSSELPDTASDDIMIYRISGAFFFGATAAVSALLDRIGAQPKALVLDFSEVPLIDSTAAKTLEGFAHKHSRAGTIVYFTAARQHVRQTLLAAGLRPPLVHYAPQIEDALALARQEVNAKA
jgi:SulP family sulfate permease